MEASQAADAFLERLEKSELLSPEQLAEVNDRHHLRDLPSVIDMARLLVKQGLLTRFQAERLLDGRYRGFFFDNYKLLDVLGAGGMGWLYEGEERDTRHKVALKVLTEKYKEDAGMLARFLLEARAGMKVNHPNVVRTLKVAEAGDLHYMVMEFVEGISLHELVSLNGPPAWKQACDFARQAAAGLVHTHRAGIVHRDIKPANLMVDHDGNVKILDFGLALLGKEKTEDEFSLTMLFGHTCLGTADFMAPEQSLDGMAVDGRADIYSLGCTLYTILAASVPFPGKSVPDMLEAHRTQEPRPIRELVPDLPEAVAAIVTKMMAKKPEDRYQSAQEVIKALEPFCERKPVEFDFAAIVKARGALARERTAAQKRRGASSVSAGNSATRMSGPNPVIKPPQSARETIVTEDTTPMAMRSSISLADPFGTKREAAARLSKIHGVEVDTAPHRTVTPPALTGALYPLSGGKPIPLDQTRIVIGRADDCDVQLEAPQVSSHHCELRCGWSRWQIVDLDSRNGVWVNHVAVKDQVLLSGDRLTIAGQFGYRIEYEGDQPFRLLARKYASRVLAAVGVVIVAVLAWWLLR